ncbi:uncharacterized protein I303_104876 [Kwoniella dejecticola CBS 10117]|uniref:Barwin domain-containing protein n=1 Tax=Kwoniella dejecticola CBS 10117 TaxID=1296121 RepID=A0A1A6A437_9TREE|nr:uncharacterized protein I303_04140 [Kwoniella dejecticola CBS 10117]OBR84819.1 hypothetical protein I303_04140 [Kwoniella dejecticola CBS 10117]
MSTTSFVISVGLLALFTQHVATATSIDNARGTVYYNFEAECEGASSDFAGANLNDGMTACGYSANSLGGTSRFVAIASDMFTPSMCGAEVTITHDGKPFSFSEGPIFVGDSCPGCAGGSVIDLSGKMALEMMGACKNVPSLSYSIGTNIVGAPSGGSLSGGGGSAPATSAPASPSQPSSAVVPPASSAPPVDTVVPPVNSAPGASQPVNPATQVSANPATVQAPSASQPVNPATDPVANPATSAPAAVSASAAIPPAVPTIPTTQVAAPASTGRGRWGGGGGPAALVAQEGTDAAASASASPSDVLWAVTTGNPASPTGPPLANALFAEEDVSGAETGQSTGSCKRRKRRLGRSH